MAADVRRRMIDATALLLARQGLQGTSFTDVLERSAAPRGSLYHHFPEGKQQLVLAAIGAAGERAVAVLDRLEGRSAVEVAQGFFALWRSVLTASEFGVGCAVLAVTIASDGDELLDAARDVFRQWAQRLAELLAGGGVPADRASSLAATLIAGSEGAVVLARSERSFASFDAVTTELSRLVELSAAGTSR